ncbi:MAG: nodulation protein NfeD [Candidatus Eremiobacteraeota bacterium]|nr:nodulation protein NfeD [Candidatus Eremiobacteraeota bacterium]
MFSRFGLIGALALLAVLATPALAVPAGSAARAVDLVRLDGVVGPASARHVLRALDEAARDGSQALVLVLDTPGGLMKSMDEITRAMLNSPVPVVVYVYPHGARAASAGVFITYAANLAAMAPATHLGAAHPVGLGASGGSIDKTEMTKLTNDAVAEIQGFAARRGRNAAWAERAVRQSETLTAEDALRRHVVDLIADSPSQLLAKIDGRTVQTAAGTRVLATRNARVTEIPFDLAELFLDLLSDPNVGFILMTIGFYGIVFELSNPGLVFPGVVGGVAMLLAFVSFAVISVNVAGLLLIVFALVLFVADIKVPSHGVLTAGGIGSFVLGSLLLTGDREPFLRISLTLIVTVAVLTAPSSRSRSARAYGRSGGASRPDERPWSEPKAWRAASWLRTAPCSSRASCGKRKAPTERFRPGGGSAW